MFFISFISKDNSLRNALNEQFRQNDAWNYSVFSSLDDALAAWSDALPPIIVWDSQTAFAKEDVIDFFVMRLEDMQPNPLLIVLGDVPPIVEKSGVTEKISKPFRLGYLISRLQFYQRILQKEPDVTLQLGDWIFEPREHRLVLKNNDLVIKLTDKEVSVLEYLYTAGDFVSREELLASVWGYGAKIDTHTLETHIYRLRKKLMTEHDGKKDVFVSDGGGYKIEDSWIKNE